MLGFSEGFVAPLLGYIHCDKLKVFPQETQRGRRKRPAGVARILGRATFCFGFESGCRQARALAINDDGIVPISSPPYASRTPTQLPCLLFISALPLCTSVRPCFAGLSLPSAMPCRCACPALPCPGASSLTLPVCLRALTAVVERATRTCFASPFHVELAESL